MKNIDEKSLQIFEDMKSGLLNQGYNEDDLNTFDDDPLYCEVQIKNNISSAGEYLYATLWVRYLPNPQQIVMGVSFPYQIPEEKMPITMVLLDLMNSLRPLQRLTICPICNRVKAIAEISLKAKRFPKEMFQILLSSAERNANMEHPIIRQIVEYSIDDLISITFIEFPEFSECWEEIVHSHKECRAAK